MTDRIPSRQLRLLRKRAGLTQAELARLAGYRKHNAIGQIETGSRQPSTRELLTLELVFGVPGCVMFPEIAEHLRIEILGRARILREIDKAYRASKQVVRAAIKRIFLERLLVLFQHPLPFKLNAFRPWNFLSQGEGYSDLLS